MSDQPEKRDYLSQFAALRGTSQPAASPPPGAAPPEAGTAPQPGPAPDPAAAARPAPPPEPPRAPEPPRPAGPPPGQQLQPTAQPLPPQMNPAPTPARADTAAEVAKRWPARAPLMVGVLSLALLFGGFGAWAAFSRIAGAVVAPGQVEVQSNRQVVQHPDGGVVQEILVTEGATVAAGDPLIRLDGTLVQTELAIVEGQYFELLARRGRLEAERADAEKIGFPDILVTAAKDDPEVKALMDGQESLFIAKRDTIAQSLDQLTKQDEQVADQIEGLDAQKSALERQKELLSEELKDQRTLLDKGLAQAPRVLALEREAANLEGRLGETVALRAQAETRRTEIAVQRLRLTAERRETAETELRDQGYRELELAERRRALTEQINRLDIRAPVSGVVHELKVTTPRSVIRPAEPVMFLIPQDRPLIIAARVVPIHVDEVRPGMEVKLRLPAFNARTTPEIDGTLLRVSPDAVLDEATRTSYYRAEVTIPPEQMAKLGDLALIPGMPVEVYVQTGERSPMAYLMKPLTDYFARAFRDN